MFEMPIDTDKYFNKKFELPCDGVLPEVEVFFSPAANTMPENIKTIKSIINFVKSKLNTYQLEEWSLHTKNRNPAQLITNYLKNQIRAEFVTQAFSKFFECVSAFPMVTNVDKVFQSVHLCEAPGAFVAALNHYLKQHHPEVEFRWRASTLNPYYEGNTINHTILDDRLISHTFENWIFGDDYDGDILKERNVRSLIDYCSTLEKISLVTCDGSVDCNDTPDRQEEMVAPLHYAEFVTSLAILADGGTMLLKMFTIYELSSLSLLYVLSCCFESLHAFKPATSKEGNSECYFIAIGYKKATMTDDILEKLISNLTVQSENPMLALHRIPESFSKRVHEMTRVFMNWQVEVIESNIRTFHFYPRYEYERVEWLRHQMIQDYVNRYGVASIRTDQKLVPRLTMVNDINLNVRGQQGSYNERQVFLSLNRVNQYNQLVERLTSLRADVLEITMRTISSPLSLSINVAPAEFINIIRGRTVQRVLSSKFMHAKIVKFFTEVQDYIQAVEPYEGPRYTIDGNRFRVEREYFKRAPVYEEFEKDVIRKLLAFILESDHEDILIYDLPMFTQFVVGVILFLSLFVFNVVFLNRSAYVISLKTLRPNGKENLKVLMKALEPDPNATKAILGITDTQRLFAHSNEYYVSCIDYNNNMSLRFCFYYLGLVEG